MGKRTRSAAAAHRAQAGITRDSFRELRLDQPSPERDAHHESGHAVLNWLYGVGFVHDPVIELGTASNRRWQYTNPTTGQRWEAISSAVTHSTRVTAPAGVPLDRFDVGALRRLAVGNMAGPMAEGSWWAARGHRRSLEELCGLTQSRVD